MMLRIFDDWGAGRCDMVVAEKAQLAQIFQQEATNALHTLMAEVGSTGGVGVGGGRMLFIVATLMRSDVWVPCYIVVLD